MVDFDKLKNAKLQSDVINPSDIFRRLPKPPGINDLYTSQDEVLKEWFDRRGESDLVIKLHTGGGKTLVGLLIAQSLINETKEPIIYLCPTVQLIEQTLEKAKEYGIPAVSYERGKDLPREFTSGKSVLLCTYNALFNGRSKFGVEGNIAKETIKAGGIILDDAHVAYSSMRDAFTLRVEKGKAEDDEGKAGEDYNFLTNTFRDDFIKYGKIGSYDDIISGSDHSGVIEVPYWSWKEKTPLVRKYLQKRADNYPMGWAFIRDIFDYCHCLVTQDAFVITPLYPPVDMIPTFGKCERRIYMSATISDDSAIIRTFDADPTSLSKPITSNSLAGVSERMILIPELMPIPVDDFEKLVKELARWAATKIKAGTVVLAPSKKAAQEWSDTGLVADTTEKVGQYVKNLQEGSSEGPFVFANRYDGIDLPGDACRLLIMAGLPRGANEYDSYRSSVFFGGEEFKSSLAQRIEQGIGRGGRGSSDFCVVILTGHDLTGWIDRPANQERMTSSTRAQLTIGDRVTGQIESLKELGETILKCLKRDDAWKRYHAETLAELVVPTAPAESQLKFADAERTAFDLWRRNMFEDAIQKIKRFCEREKDNVDVQARGWLEQMAARIALYWEREDLARELQQSAYLNNKSLHRPLNEQKYLPVAQPGAQAQAIVAGLKAFRSKRGFLADFDQMTSLLTATATSNQFEESLAKLGTVLGFSTDRPESKYGIGPDVLWLLNESTGLVIEAKSQKLIDNPITKREHGQLLSSAEWFKREYPEYECIRVSMHPNQKVGAATVTNNSKVLNFEKLAEMVIAIRKLIVELDKSIISDAELEIKCEQLLQSSDLSAKRLPHKFLQSFESGV